MSSNLTASSSTTTTNHDDNLFDEVVFDNIGPSDQRKVRHLTNISIRNLSLYPKQGLYNFSSLLLQPPPSSSSISSNSNTNKTTSQNKSKGKGKQIENNNSNNNNNNQHDFNRTIISGAIDDTDLYLRQQSKKSNGMGSSSRKRGLSNASIGSTSSSSGNIMDEIDYSKGTGRVRGKSVGGGSSKRINEEEEDYLVDRGEDGEEEEIGGKNGIRGSRIRSASINTVGSSSTIRPINSATLPRSSDGVEKGVKSKTLEGIHTHTSSNERIRSEHERRRETLNKRLVDSFITLSLVSNQSSSNSTSTIEEESTPKNRFLRTSSSSSQRPSRPRASSSSSMHKSPSFHSTSSPSETTTSSPFFISLPVNKKLHPSFEIDSQDFLLPMDEEVEDWQGLREGRILVGVWVKGGNEKLIEEKEKEEEWKLLIEWDVEFDGLICLGKDPLSFPPLPPNTLLFRLSKTYYTTPTIYKTTLGLDEDYISSNSDYSSDENNDRGNLSDPGGDISINLKLKRKEKVMEKKKSEMKKIREAEVEILKNEREGKEVEGAGMDDVVKSVQIQTELLQVKRSVKELQKKLDNSFENEDDFGVLEREVNQLKDRVEDFEAVHSELVLDLGEYEDDLEKQRKAIKARRDRLKLAGELAEESKVLDLKIDSSLVENDILCQNIQQLTRSRRTQLITLLSHLFPIDPSPSSPSSLLFTIHSLPLPNTLSSSLSSSSINMEIYSSALGYVAQLVTTLAAYLAVPLCYPVKCFGSRSLVMDLISMMSGPRAFPLYGEGVERYRFDYGVFLLNKNIEQLMYSQGLIVLDLRNTLPNLKSLLLNLSYDPSHSLFESSTLSIPIGFEPPQEELIEQEPQNLSIQVYNVSSSSSSSSSSSHSYESDSDEDDRPSPPPKSPASTIRASSIKSNNSSIRTITKSIKNGNGNGNGERDSVVEKLNSVLVPDGGGGSGGGSNSKNKGAWRVGKLV